MFGGILVPIGLFWFSWYDSLRNKLNGDWSPVKDHPTIDSLHSAHIGRGAVRHGNASSVHLRSRIPDGHISTLYSFSYRSKRSLTIDFGSLVSSHHARPISQDWGSMGFFHLCLPRLVVHAIAIPFLCECFVNPCSYSVFSRFGH